MNLGVLLSFRRCPKHPKTPPFAFGTPIAYFGNPLPGRSREIEGDWVRLRLDLGEVQWNQF